MLMILPFSFFIVLFFIFTLLPSFLYLYIKNNSSLFSLLALKAKVDIFMLKECNIIKIVFYHLTNLFCSLHFAMYV